MRDKLHEDKKVLSNNFWRNKPLLVIGDEAQGVALYRVVKVSTRNTGRHARIYCIRARTRTVLTTVGAMTREESWKPRQEWK